MQVSGNTQGFFPYNVGAPERELRSNSSPRPDRGRSPACPAPPGEYYLGFVVEDFDGNQTADYVLIEVYEGY